MNDPLVNFVLLTFGNRQYAESVEVLHLRVTRIIKKMFADKNVITTRIKNNHMFNVNLRTQ